MAQRYVHRDSYIEEWPEAGLIMINSPADPVPSIDLDEHQQIIELDGRLVAEFDMMDHFIKDNGIDTSIKMMGTASGRWRSCATCAMHSEPATSGLPIPAGMATSRTRWFRPKLPG